MIILNYFIFITRRAINYKPKYSMKENILNRMSYHSNICTFTKNRMPKDSNQPFHFSSFLYRARCSRYSSRSFSNFSMNSLVCSNDCSYLYFSRACNFKQVLFNQKCHTQICGPPNDHSHFVFLRALFDTL